MILLLNNFAKSLIESISNPLSDINNISNITDKSNETREKLKENISHTQIKTKLAYRWLLLSNKSIRKTFVTLRESSGKEVKIN